MEEKEEECTVQLANDFGGLSFMSDGKCESLLERKYRFAY